MFNHEKLEVYQLAVRFDSIVSRLVPRRGSRVLREQLERASSSIMACIAEGAGRWAPAEKRHFYGIGRGSATECAAHLDALRNRALVSPNDYREARTLLLSIVRILTKLSAPPRDPEPEAPPRDPEPEAPPRDPEPEPEPESEPQTQT